MSPLSTGSSWRFRCSPSCALGGATQRRLTTTRMNWPVQARQRQLLCDGDVRDGLDDPDHPAIAAPATALRKTRVAVVAIIPAWRTGVERQRLPFRPGRQPAVRVTPFRKQVLAGLADDRPSGTLQADANGRVTIVFDKHWTTTVNVRADNPAPPGYRDDDFDCATSTPGSSSRSRASPGSRCTGRASCATGRSPSSRPCSIPKRFFVAGQGATNAQKAYPAGQSSSGR